MKRRIVFSLCLCVSVVIILAAPKAKITVPKGFQVERVAGPDLVSYPMLGTLDDRGRLFLCESSGNTLNNKQMTESPDYRIRMLEDVDGDGIYDRSTIFADKLTLPAGAVWYRGSLYVASPPDLIRFDDLDGDGVAESRQAIVTGWNLSANAASLHGPFLGPDGWLYLTDGRHGYQIETKEGTVLKGQASRIWRVRPDGTGLEWVAGGGFDNPVELVFTPPGEIIGTMTYFVDPRDGQRDALLHFVEGGVYPKWHPVVSEFKRTGDLMPVMTKFARIAPSGLARYRGSSFGPAYQGNLFSAQFNPHRVQRHILYREGATFRTEDEDFLTSSDPDFHPTDVMEDADGSLLVVDTGAWFIHGCPISRVSKPEIKGGIYRVRKIGAPAVKDPRGQMLAWNSGELARYLEDPRPAVRDRALERLVELGETPALAAVREKAAADEVRCAAVWGLFRIGGPKAQQAVRDALRDPHFRVRIAAARAAGMSRDAAAVDRLMELAKQDRPPVRRQAATALGQIGDQRATEALVAAATRAGDRFIEHAVVHSLIGLKSPAPLEKALKASDPMVRKAALIALDQMDDAPLQSRHLIPMLSDPNKELRGAALWVASHHPDWSGDVLQFLRARLRAAQFPADESEPVREALIAFCSNADVQKMAADPAVDTGRQLFLLDTMDRCPLKQLPELWIQRLGELLDRPDARVRRRAVALIRSRALPGLDDKLERIAAETLAPADLRVAALGALISRRRQLPEPGFQFLLSRLDPKADAALRLSAAQVLGKAELSSNQLVTLAHRHLLHADPLTLPSLLDAFHKSKQDEVGKALVEALLKSRVSIGEPDGERLEQILGGYSEAVGTTAKPLLAKLREAQKLRTDRLRKLEPLLTAGGDIGRGRRIFFGDKVACSSCHTIGAEGGHVGPDLTAVGAIRSGHDLLEAIVFPSASFVPGHEVYLVETPEETYSGVRGESTSDALVLITGPHAEIRIPRNKIRSMKPSKVSLMPEGLDESLTQREFTDLLAFLQAQKSRESARLR
jgi:putative membrane-bound dehydrogenase-like protein